MTPEGPEGLGIKRAALLRREGSCVLGKVRGRRSSGQTDGWGPDGRTRRETRSQRLAENWPDHHASTAPSVRLAGSPVRGAEPGARSEERWRQHRDSAAAERREGPTFKFRHLREPSCHAFELIKEKTTKII